MRISVRIVDTCQNILANRERGQAMIMFAVLATGLLMTLGLAVEGGRLFVEQRHMQAVADVAALVGAEKLQVSAATARSDACAYAGINHFNNCTGSSPPAAGASYTTVCVPPESTSPYDTKVMPAYGGSSSGCTTPSTSEYIEVEIAENLGTVPIFNVPVNLYAHAVARDRVPSGTDFALLALNPTSNSSPGGISKGGSAPIYVLGSVMSNNLDTSKSIALGGSATFYVCNGYMLTSAAEPVGSVSQLVTFNGSNVTWSPGSGVDFSPASCSNATDGLATDGTPDSPKAYLSQIGQISDPYGSTCYPGSADANCPGSMSSNCPQCTSAAYYWSGWTPTNRTGGTWCTTTQAGCTTVHVTNNNYYEFFPGTYPNGITLDGGVAIFNPGIYTIGGGSNPGLKITGGTICMYGAPACDVMLNAYNNGSSIPNTTVNCASATFGASTSGSTVKSSGYYYYCSPWGKYDTVQHGASDTRTTRTAPTFWDMYQQSNSTDLLNGVTFYMQSGTPVNISGSAAMSLAFPNPCPGTGSGAVSGSSTGAPSPFTGPGGSIPFPQGQGNGSYYYYPSGSIGYADGQLSGAAAGTQSDSSSFQVYPNADLTRGGDTPCVTAHPDEVWQGEFGPQSQSPFPQHLHFLFFAMNDATTGSCSSVTVVGSGGNAYQNFWGIIHTFPYRDGLQGQPYVPASGYSGCSVTLSGNAGSLNGPAMFEGQVIADDESLSGSSLVQIFDRPSGNPSTAGVSLVE